ncbi:MAG TPA: helix-turn-helix domain-containing protein [Candidatus Eisenbacteria bacterium]|nr:helix-turn-helix domain-containing protein [Candidatus Eisenbacteria bacterium]
MSKSDFAADVSGVGSLAEPVRRDLYLYVVAQPEPVSRDQAAAGVGVPRHTAKFHLDRLVEEGLLDTDFRRISGRQGPGAGRPSKLYRRSAREVSVSLPERHYDLAGHLMAQAIGAAAAEGTPVLAALHRAAAEAGAALGERARAEADTDAGRDPLGTVCEALAAHGYEPHRHGDGVTLANCPFHALAQEHTQLVCGMNLALIGAVTQSLGDGALEARLDPGEGRCCVVVSPR